MVYINFFNITRTDIKFLCALPFIQFSYCETSLKFINIVKWITLLRIKLQIKKPSDARLANIVLNSLEAL